MAAEQGRRQLNTRPRVQALNLLAMVFKWQVHSEVVADKDNRTAPRTVGLVAAQVGMARHRGLERLDKVATAGTVLRVRVARAGDSVLAGAVVAAVALALLVKLATTAELRIVLVTVELVLQATY